MLIRLTSGYAVVFDGKFSVVLDETERQRLQEFAGFFIRILMRRIRFVREIPESEEIASVVVARIYGYGRLRAGGGNRYR